MQNNPVELLSPAGSFEALHAAIQAGADSVYFGVGHLNMRARSSGNVQAAQLEEIVSVCKQKKVKSYLALNTVMYDHDLTVMKQTVDQAKAAGISGIIASDQATIGYAANAGVPVHISTQVNVSNIETVAFYANFADVVVLARELSLKQVAAIVRDIERKKITGPSGEPVKVEIFAHGALCMAISGKCYLSLHSHNASANRGACIQNCRRQYVVTDKDEGHQLLIDNEYIMSAKDLCTIDFLDQVIDTGVSILKIEGRGRSPDYVHNTTKCYRQAIDAIKNGTYSKLDVEDLKDRLSEVFNRDFWDGYYLGRTMGEWAESYGSQATEKKIQIGKGIKYFKRKKAGEFLLESHNLKLGDQILITGPTTGLVRTEVTELRVKNLPVDKVEQGDYFSMPLENIIRKSDKLFKVTVN